MVLLREWCGTITPLGCCRRQCDTSDGLDILEKLWDTWDAATDDHPEAFTESLQQLLPDLSDRNEIEVDLLSKLVLANGDVSLVPFVRIGKAFVAESAK